ncbi:Neuropeptides capa receptor [Eumeta japonica]|uniref:Neuropeptides capa receptor n=1 Tax=Eumeta variegata TaxID=151549 RepID=A0A4C1YY62_EUMVA|nr:Neuropeptides capa receptor [Eumeta japonica]
MQIDNDYCERYCIYEKTFNTEKCTDQIFVDCVIGPKTAIQEGPLLAVTVFTVLLMLIGVLGNIAVCIVIIKHPSMRTNTNRYLFSLAINDLLLLIFGVPSDIWKYYNAYGYTLGLFYCKMTTFLLDMTSYCSVLTVVSFSLERYFAICHPIRSHTTRKRPSPVLILCIIWALSTVYAMPLTWKTDIISDVKYPHTNRWLKEADQCNLPSESREGDGNDWMNVYFKVTSVIFFVIPMVVLMAVYIQIGMAIRKRGFRNENGNIRSNVRTSRGTIRLLIAVVVSFFICWAPFHYQRIFNYALSHEEARKLYVITGCFYYLSAALNPILYSVISRKYRTAFKEVLFRDRNSSREQDSCLKEYTRNNITSETRITGPI